MTRQFQTFAHAASELRRDVSRAPRVHSQSVQNVNAHLYARETTNFSYSIISGGIPENPRDIITQTISAGIYPSETWDKELINLVEQWMNDSDVSRHEPWSVGYTCAPYDGLSIPDRMSPFLGSMVEGNHYSYTYEERLWPLIDPFVNNLLVNPTSRRGFLPIFQPLDLIRAATPTRVPCSIGYYAILRPVNLTHTETLYLDYTYIQRSCDLNRFWASDVWFAFRFMKRVVEKINSVEMLDSKVELGHFNHNIFSLHSFDGTLEQVY